MLNVLFLKPGPVLVFKFLFGASLSGFEGDKVFKYLIKICFMFLRGCVEKQT